MGLRWDEDDRTFYCDHQGAKMVDFCRTCSEVVCDCCAYWHTCGLCRDCDGHIATCYCSVVYCPKCNGGKHCG